MQLHCDSAAAALRPAPGPNPYWCLSKWSFCLFCPHTIVGLDIWSGKTSCTGLEIQNMCLLLTCRRGKCLACDDRVCSICLLFPKRDFLLNEEQNWQKSSLSQPVTCAERDPVTKSAIEGVLIFVLILVLIIIINIIDWIMILIMNLGVFYRRSIGVILIVQQGFRTRIISLALWQLLMVI